MMSLGAEIMEQQMIEGAVAEAKVKITRSQMVDNVIADTIQRLFKLCKEREKYRIPNRESNVKFWRQKNGKVIAIADMTDLHLQNTIKFLERQIDGSIHDEFVYDNIIAMKNELKRRNETMKIQNVDLKVVGVTFTNEDTGEKRSDIIRELMNKNQTDIKIQLVREPENKYDMNAIKVLADDKQIGYIGKEYATIIAPLMDECEEFSAVVKGVGEYKNRPYCEITINQL